MSNKKINEMKNIFLLSLGLVIGVLKTSAQDSGKEAQYKVPEAYSFDYKVVYNIDMDQKRAPETITYLFTKSGDYMSIESPEMQKEKDMNFMVSTKDGMMITFSDKEGPGTPGKNGKVITVMDMRSMFKSGVESAAAIAKTMPKKEYSDTEKKKPNVDITNFVKTGRTKDFFGYPAEEYSRDFSAEENGTVHSGTVSVWYAKVDFDPEMMFSMGLGNLGGGGISRSKTNQSLYGNIFVLGLTQKNWLMVEMDMTEKGGPNKAGMKVISLEKTNFSKRTEGYYVQNFSGMSMKEMMEKEMGTK
jgi:hypothetical protein